MNGLLDSRLHELTTRLRAVVGTDLVGVYAGGSYALGAYEPARSDVDVAAVVSPPAAQKVKEAIVAAVRHEALPCPARGLELVLYRLAAVRKPTGDAAFELNLNTGAGMPFRADFEPGAIESHWFAIDRSILRRHGIVLHGPPARDVFAEIPRSQLIDALLESVRWHEAGSARGDDAVLNACRALRFADEGVWSSKPVAGEWALSHLQARELVEQALAARYGGAPLDVDAVAQFLSAAASQLARAGRDGELSPGP